MFRSFTTALINKVKDTIINKVIDMSSENKFTMTNNALIP